MRQELGKPFFRNLKSPIKEPEDNSPEGSSGKPNLSYHPMVTAKQVHGNFRRAVQGPLSDTPVRPRSLDSPENTDPSKEEKEGHGRRVRGYCIHEVRTSLKKLLNFRGEKNTKKALINLKYDAQNKMNIRRLKNPQKVDQKDRKRERRRLRRKKKTTLGQEVQSPNSGISKTH